MEEMNLGTAPKELILTIFSYLDINNIFKSLCIHPHWAALAKDPHFWKALVFKGEMAHSYSADQKDVEWQRVVRLYIMTKKNIIKGRCVMDVLCSRVPTKSVRVEIIIGESTVHDKYAIVTWESMESFGYSYTEQHFLKTELWDLEQRRCIREYPQEALEFIGDFIVHLPTGRYNSAMYNDMRYSKFDLNEFPPKLDRSVSWQERELGRFPVRNSDPKKAMLCFTEYERDEDDGYAEIIDILDMETGSLLLKKKMRGYNVRSFHGSILSLSGYEDSDRVFINVYTQKEERVNMFPSGCEVIGDYVCLYRNFSVINIRRQIWGSVESHFRKYNIKTKEYQDFPVSHSNIFNITAFNGVLMCHSGGTGVRFIDPATGEALGELQFLRYRSFESRPLSNGTLAFTGASLLSVLSFRDEDVGRKIELLSISPNGAMEVEAIEQGNLCHKINNINYTSKIIRENEAERYCLIYDESNNNKCAQHLLDNRGPGVSEDQYSILFAPIYLGKEIDDEINMLEVDITGRCWIFYEKLINGRWTKCAPEDNWSEVKGSLEGVVMDEPNP